MEQRLAELVDRIDAAAAARQPLCLQGGGTKRFYGNAPRGELLDLSSWSGIVDYDPSELVVTARGGTSLAQVEALLHERDQMLAFEPPHFGAGATLGGCIAAGLAGPRRSAAGYAYGSVRDFVLGAKLLDGRGRVLNFGGTVIKNVAGYDVSRVLAGSLGILGILLEVSVKVLPRPPAERTLRMECGEAQAIARLNEWGGQPLPISASLWREGELLLRLSGAAEAVERATSQLGGEPLADAAAVALWRAQREHTDPWFDPQHPLWRISVPSNAAMLGLDGAQCIEWGGALRWLRTSASVEVIRQRARALGGHATLFRGGDRDIEVFTPLSSALLAIHQRLKDEFDPARIFNPGRLYREL